MGDQLQSVISWAPWSRSQIARSATTYTSTDCSSVEVEDEFYGRLSSLLQIAKRPYTLIVAGDFNVYVCKGNQTERHLGRSFCAAAQRTNNGDHALQLCLTKCLFLPSTIFKQ